jgi:hypothetical protein
MNAWINQMAEITGMRQFGFDFSISDIGSLVQGPCLLWIIAAIVIFLITAFDNAYGDRQPNRHSDVEQD